MADIEGDSHQAKEPKELESQRARKRGELARDGCRVGTRPPPTPPRPGLVPVPTRFFGWRADEIRSLMDGYPGSFAETGSHEIGHLAGRGHDTSDPRSMMNVVEGGALRQK